MKKLRPSPALPLVLLVLLGACAHGPPVPPLLRGGGWGGYERTAPVTVYGRDQLFQYMNGEAEVYLPHGFRLLYTATHASPEGDALLSVEAFDMGSAVGAEAMLERYSGGKGEPVTGLGAVSWTDGWVLLFVRGPYFVRVWGAPETPVPPSPDEIAALARLLDREIVDGGP